MRRTHRFRVFVRRGREHLGVGRMLVVGVEALDGFTGDRLDTATAEDATMTGVGTTEAADATAADDEAVTEADDRGSDANATGRCRRGST